MNNRHTAATPKTLEIKRGLHPDGEEHRSVKRRGGLIPTRKKRVNGFPAVWPSGEGTLELSIS